LSDVIIVDIIDSEYVDTWAKW